MNDRVALKWKILNKIPDEYYLRIMFRKHTGKRLDLKNPKTYNEKLQWLKLYNRKPEYTVMVDKYKVRDYIKDKLGEEYLIPLIGVWDNSSEINFEELPEQFVLKCNHNSGTGMYICTDKNKMDIKRVKEDLDNGLAQNYYLTGREWPYKDVPRKIICEKFMVDDRTKELRDYKFYCFDGEVKMIMVNSDRSSGKETKADYFDKKYNRLNITWGYKHSAVVPKKPEKFEEMIEIAELLSKNMPHVRIDLYECNEKIYFGEISFFDGSGFDTIEPYEWDLKLGSWIKL